MHNKVKVYHCKYNNLNEALISANKELFAELEEILKD